MREACDVPRNLVQNLKHALLNPGYLQPSHTAISLAGRRLRHFNSPAADVVFVTRSGMQLTTFVTQRPSNRKKYHIPSRSTLKITEHTKCSTWHSNTICRTTTDRKVCESPMMSSCLQVPVDTSQCFPRHPVVLLKVPPSEHLCPAKKDLEATLEALRSISTKLLRRRKGNSLRYTKRPVGFILQKVRERVQLFNRMPHCGCRSAFHWAVDLATIRNITQRLE